MAAGKPIVVSDLAPMNELVAARDDLEWPGQHAGSVVPPGDAQALARSLVTLLCDPDIRRAMGQRGQELVRCCYDVRDTARQYEKQYLEMAG
jgi:glycosyltransferase involved in cell wall biosynthesis